MTEPTTDTFDATEEPLRAIRDLISACESVFGPGNEWGEQDILKRAQTGFATLRAIFGDNRPNEAVAFESPIEPSSGRPDGKPQEVSS